MQSTDNQVLMSVIANIFAKAYWSRLILVLVFCYCASSPIWAEQKQVKSAEKIEFQWQGIDGELLENAKQYVRLVEAAQKEKDLNPQRIRYLFKVAKESILWSLHPFGYYHAEVEDKLSPPNAQRDYWLASFKVSLNQAIRVEEIKIELLGDAKNDEKFEQLVKDFPLKKGGVLVQTLYEKAKRQFEELLSERGYLDGEISQHEIKIYKSKYQAKINLVINSAKRYCINQVEFEQNRFKSSLLKRYIPFQPGTPYTREKLLSLRHALIDSGYFEQIDIQKNKTKSKQQPCLNLLVKPTLKKKDRYRGRIGYGTDTGVRVGVDARFSYLNAYGHKAKLSGGYTVNKNRHLLNADYIIPMGQEKTSFWQLSAAYKAEDFTSADVEVDTIDGLTRVKDFTLKLAWNQKRTLFNSLELKEEISLEYLNESYELFELILTPFDQKFFQDLEDKSPEFVEKNSPDGGFALLRPKYDIFSLGFNWVYENTDDPIYANRGYRIDWGIKGALEGFGSDVSYWQTRLKTKSIFRLSPKGRLLLRTDLAYTDVEEKKFFEVPINQLPKNLLFATGGDRSIRGYKFEALRGGEVLPLARNLAVASVEYEHEIYPQWSLASFVDIGNAFNDYKNFKAEYGVGVGVRWLSPVGMVRLDIAHGSGPQGSPIRLHFTIGPDF